MYLSKIHVPWSQAKNPYDLHRALWLLFPNRPDSKRDFLFRVEKLKAGIGAEVIVQSKTRVVAPENGTALLATKEYSLQLQSGQVFRFCLRANPVKTIKDKGKGVVELNGKTFIKTVRVPLIKEEAQKSWLVKKLESSAVVNMAIAQMEPAIYFYKQKEKNAGKIQTVRFEGTLSVQNPEKLVELIEFGIGPAKGFGCGLLSLAKS